MLKAICIVSANDCTVAMAEYLAGSEEEFVNKMNERARELGMNDTTFKNCHGIDEDGHETSAYDIALMSRELLKNHPSITNYTTIWMDTLRDGESELVNTNKLIRNYSGTTGLKTGSTSIALYNLSASATRDGLSLIAVIMKAPTTQVRFSEATKLLDYGFSNYSYKLFASKNDTIKTVKVGKGVESTLDVKFAENAGVIIRKGEEKNVVQKIVLEEVLNAPIKEAEKVGEVVYTLNDKEIRQSRFNSVKRNQKHRFI
jgi:D-alanyl-D-alanine carboxypeptidase (penicillin-binding protein 5/6)